ncbi:MAG: patatin-like phospholipase family protein [Saccharospirillum sp.]|uniref:patatin-like phospholipase family protein n=1 Tax=Saccharospirillum sp. TaxID=2033801 RepID=UPI00329793F4
MKKTSMALGSGGARGLAHIGILRALQDSGDYQISSIAGSSIGALVGGLYAAGKMDDYADWVSELSLGEIWKLLDFSYSRVGLFKGDRIMDRLAELVGDTQIDDLNMPFSAVATDIQKREEVWITQGSMFEAIRASIAIPGFFTPVRRNGRLLVDGGLLSPLPMTPLLYHDAEFNVVVSLNGNAHQPEPKKPVPDEAADSQDEPSNKLLQWFQQTRQSLGFENASQGNSNSVVDIFAQSVEAMQDRIARYQLAAFEPDLLIEVPVDACGILDFHRGKEMIDLGYELTRQALKNKR